MATVVVACAVHEVVYVNPFYVIFSSICSFFDDIFSGIRSFFRTYKETLLMLALPLTIPLILTQLLVIKAYEVLRDVVCAVRDFVEYTGFPGVCLVSCSCIYVILRVYAYFFKN